MSPLLHLASAADAARVADILFATRLAFMPYAPSAHPEDDVRAWVATRLLPTGGVYLAQIDGSVVGVMATEKRQEASWITQMAVEPASVGRGIGTHMLAHAVRVLNPPVRLWTFQQNLGARRFYERHGFVALELTDGRDNEEQCPDVLYELAQHLTEA